MRGSGTTEAISQGREKKGGCHACVPKQDTRCHTLMHFGVQARSLRSLAMTKRNYDPASREEGMTGVIFYLMPDAPCPKGTPACAKASAGRLEP